jgi:hypothetical protein
LTEDPEAKMKWFFATLAVAAAMAVVPQHASAATVASLQDWCFNVDGVNVSTNACNTGGPVSLPANVNGASFDFTLGSSDPGYPTTAASNSLGSVTITLGSGASQYVLAYMDYDLNYNNAASNQDSGTAVNGPPGAGVSYELSDPNTSTIFNDFTANALTNTNNVGTYGGPNTPCCDVSWALGVDLDVATTQTVTFTVSTVAPASGFYLEQTNGIDDTQHIFLSETVGGSVAPPPGIPEPASLVLLATGLAGVFLLRKRKAA